MALGGGWPARLARRLLAGFGVLLNVLVSKMGRGLVCRARDRRETERGAGELERLISL